MSELDTLLTALESDLSEARGEIMRLHDIIGSKDIQISLMHDEIGQLAPERLGRQGRRWSKESARMVRALGHHMRGH